MRAQVLSRQKHIAVEVDSNGILTLLDITDAALARGGRSLSRELMDLTAKATIQVRGRTLAITTELLGEDDPIVLLTAAQLDTDRDETPEQGGVRW